MATSQEQVVVEAANKYKIPPKILWGVYGVETGHGSNVTTSSGGAKGAFQFIQPTAASYSYPWTNEQTPAIFKAQAEGAARYLSALYNQTKSWESAIQGYSGHSYTLKHVEENAFSPGLKLAEGSSEGPKGGKELAEGAEAATGVPLKKAGEAVDSVGGFLAALQSPSTWLRLAEGVGGIVLFMVGLKTLTKGTAGATVVREQGSTIKRAVRKAAEVAAVPK
jgi:hypothetical protein